MHYELISAGEYENLPEDSDNMFVELEGICRRNMTQMIDRDSAAEMDHVIRMQYMTTVASAAAELGIEGLQYPNNVSFSIDDFPEFLLRASGVVTRIRLRSTRKNREYSVKLAVRTKGLIELQVRKLRDAIEKSEFSEDKKKKLYEKLDELMTEVNSGSRLSFAKTMGILACLGVAVASGTSFLADAPQALATITSLIGQDKDLEDQERLRIEGPRPVKSLPSPQTESPELSQFAELDDEIPF